MPFISINIIQTETNVPFISFSAGGDQNILCSAIVQLDAVILVGDINNHTFEWEQIDGTPVTLNDADTLSPWFINPNTTDFIFRLWIDRYTPVEKFSDINIFRNPTSISSAAMTITGDGYVPTVLELGRYSSEVRIPVNVTVELSSYSDQNGTFASHTCRGGQYSIMWELPTGRTIHNILLGIEIQKLENGVWVTDGIQDISLRYWNIEQGVTYRLVMIWEDRLRGVISRETDNTLYRTEYLRPLSTEILGTAAATSAPSISGTSQLTAFSTFVPSLIDCDFEVYCTSAPSISGTTQRTSFSTFIPGLKACPMNEVFCTAAPSISGTYNPNVYVFRVGGISIGSP
jgi:hypothetical protein